ncbi:phage virion morphogenesis protein [Ornithobacterium rhinotracheale]|uniref:phage virion morphogenesis protein n=1 Tax=Ornithobacterium rhinotracheale TaxID=28251 RepID=UPI001FF52A40|nr:phage virion morphogenesis protein [Ornithobacterium rhinotracheale]MCK0203066.1 phage virion morphogenesis protein [Ornithobacterium rhinotracheale]
MSRNLEQVMRAIEQRTHQFLDDLPIIIANEALLFAKENFDQQSWQGSSVEPWAPRKDKENERSLLVNTGNLRRSIDKENAKIEPKSNGVTITIGSDVPYARAHNFGFSGVVEQNVGEHRRKSKKGKEYFVKAHRRNMKMNIPKRQFIGDFNDSPIFADKIKEIIKLEAKKITNI